MNTDSRRRGKAKAGLVIALVVGIAIIVPVGLYMLGQIVFPSGTTSEDLSVPNTSTASSAVPQAATSPPVRRAPSSVIPSGARTMDLLVIDGDTRQPIPGIRAQVNGNATRRAYTGRTGDDGHVKIPIPSEKNPNYFNIHVAGNGYLDKRLEWTSNQPELAGEVPTTCTIMMERMTKIGGKIVDDAGQPVAGATIVFEFNKKYPNVHERVAQTAFSPNNPRNVVKSGADGSWNFSGTPMNCDSIGLAAWDYQHVSEDHSVPEPFADVSKLYDGTAVYTLHNGVTLDGVVTGPDGVPLAGVVVGRGQGRQAVNAIPEQTTDADGKFSYVYRPGQQAILTFQAQGYAPDMRQLVMGQQKQTLTVNLSKAHTVFGKVVDGLGKGVPNAEFYFRYWRGLSTINPRIQADSSGNFRWNDAPADPTTFEVDAPGLHGNGQVILQPDVENTIKLTTSWKVVATVTDAVTGQRIDNFHLFYGIEFYEGQPPNWQTEWNVDHGVEPGGKIEFTDDYAYAGIALKVEAPGYTPTESRIIKSSETGEIVLELKMKPETDLAGSATQPTTMP